MDSKREKMPLILCILDVLRRYTDAEHKLTQKELGEIIEREYGVKADRKTIRRNLGYLSDSGCDICYEEQSRQRSDGTAESVHGRLYLNREFTVSELRLIIDSLIFSEQIPYKRRRELVDKLSGLSSVYFRSHVDHVRSLPERKEGSQQLFLSVEILDEAIAKRRKVRFNYTSMGTDQRAHVRLNEDGRAKEYVVNPYQLIAANGRYYLIGNSDKYDNIAHFRVDRIRNIELLEAARKPMKNVRGLERGLDLPRHKAEHIYMFSGESVMVEFRAKRTLLNDLCDWFSNMKYTDITDEDLVVHVRVNENAMFYWALQYSPYVEVLQPAALRERVREALEAAAAKYQA